MEISNENKQRIIDLYLNSRLSFTQIIDSVMPNEGATLDDLIAVLNEYQSSVGHEIRRNKFTHSIKINKDIINNEDIFNMVENGLTDSEILDYYKKKGCCITKQAIRIRKVRVYKNKGLPVPNVSKDRKIKRMQQIELEEKRKAELNNQKKKEVNEFICSLREQGLSFDKIRTELRQHDINLSPKTIAKRYLLFCNKNGIEPMEFKRGPFKAKNIDKNEVYNLREEGYSYTRIAEKYNVTPATNKSICKNVYGEKNEEIPALIKNVNLPKQELMELKELGFSVKKITDYYNSKGVDVSYKTVFKKLGKVYSEQGKKMPFAKRKHKDGKIDLQYVDKNVLKRLIDNMRITKNATDEEIEKLYECYGIEKADKEIDER